MTKYQYTNVLGNKSYSKIANDFQIKIEVTPDMKSAEQVAEEEQDEKNSFFLTRN